MLPRSSKNKGYRAEKALERLLREHGVNAQRTPGSGSGTHDKGDLFTPDFPLLWEVENQKGIAKISGWLKQASDAAEKVHKIPVVAFCERNDQPDWTIVPTRYLIELWKSKRNPTIDSENNELIYWIKRMIESSKQVIKRIEQ